MQTVNSLLVIDDTTVTAAKEPLCESQWVQKGTHISAMGSNTPGKQEAPTSLFDKARLYCDNHTQSTRIGEFQYADATQKEKLEELGQASICKSCMFSPDDITLFDSSGIGLQDVSAAACLLEQAIKQGLMNSVPF